MKFSTRYITPEEAADMLARNAINRPLRAHWVGTLASAMSSGEWKLNGEPILIGISGNVLNGQHRLTAIIKSGRAVQFAVVTDVPDDVFDTLDQGKRRSAGDVLAISGQRNVNVLASGLRAIAFLTSDLASLSYVRTAHVVEALREHPTAEYWATRYAGEKTIRAIAPGSIVGVLTLGAELWGQDLADHFFDRLGSGEMLAGDSPIMILRQRLIESRRGGSSIHSHAQLSIIVKAWNAYTTGRKIKLLRYMPDERKPRIEAPSC